jgi:uncharacterized protein YecE (DUF72 family)
MKKAAVYIGTSGWYYDHWEGILYPPGLAKAKRFEVYVQDFNSVEINATYYRLPTNSMVAGWYRKAPKGFVYAVKANKEITHNRKLRNVTEALSKFLHIIIPLKDKLGVILFQLPPSLKKDNVLLQEFLDLLPPTVPGCFEFRHPSWECDETYDVLERSGTGHVIVSKKDYPFIERHTADFAYYRLHGPEKMCASSYSDSWLESLSDQLTHLSRQGKTSFIYFNNDIGGHAVFNARILKAFLTEKIQIKKGQHSNNLHSF